MNETNYEIEYERECDKFGIFEEEIEIRLNRLKRNDSEKQKQKKQNTKIAVLA